MKSERRQIGGRFLARARGAFSRRDVRRRKPGVTVPSEARRRHTSDTGANGAEEPKGGLAGFGGSGGPEWASQIQGCGLSCQAACPRSKQLQIELKINSAVFADKLFQYIDAVKIAAPVAEERRFLLSGPLALTNSHIENPVVTALIPQGIQNSQPVSGFGVDHLERKSQSQLHFETYAAAAIEHFSHGSRRLAAPFLLHEVTPRDPQADVRV